MLHSERKGLAQFRSCAEAAEGRAGPGMACRLILLVAVVRRVEEVPRKNGPRAHLILYEAAKGVAARRTGDPHGTLLSGLVGAC